MTIKVYIVQLMKVAFTSSLALGMIMAILVLVIGGAEGSITLDIDFSATDSILFLLGTTSFLTLVFLLVSPVSYFLYSAIFKERAGRSSGDV